MTTLQHLLKDARQHLEAGGQPVPDALRLMCAAIETAAYSPVREARRLLWREFKSDPAWRQTYVDNIACVIMDFEKQRHITPGSLGAPMTHTERNILAERIFEHIFKEE